MTDADTQDPTEPEPQPIPVMGPAVASKSLDDWFNNYCHNSPVARDTVRANQIAAFVRTIKSVLAEIPE